MFRNWAGTREAKFASQYLKIRAVVWNEVLTWSAAKFWKPTFKELWLRKYWVSKPSQGGNTKKSVCLFILSCSGPISGLNPLSIFLLFCSLPPFLSKEIQTSFFSFSKLKFTVCSSLNLRNNSHNECSIGGMLHFLCQIGHAKHWLIVQMQKHIENS